MLAMGSKTFNEPEDLEIAKGLLETCVFMYRTSATGLSPETWYIDKTEKYNPMTYNKTKQELKKLRDWWYEDGDEVNRPVQKIAVKEQKEESTRYDVKYKLPQVKSRPPSLFFGDERYLLRPETIESLFILYRITGDQKYQVKPSKEHKGYILMIIIRNMDGKYSKPLKNGAKQRAHSQPFKMWIGMI